MNICGDIVDEILSRLPVKSLLRFQVVCKEWYYHIHSDYFIAKHIKNQKTNEKMLIYHDYSRFAVTICSEVEIEDDDEDDDIRTMFHQDQQYYIEDTLDYLRNYEDNNVDVKSFLKSYNSQTMDGFEVTLVGTFNGLVCLDYWVLKDDNHDDDEDTVVDGRFITLWNPATRDFKVLPSCEVQPLEPLELGNMIGFGFDCSTNDYKVLFLQFNDPWAWKFVERINHAMIYSLNTNSWREVDYPNVQEIKLEGKRGTTVSLCENVYWVKVSFDMFRNPILLSFDMGKEVFQSTPLPLSVKFNTLIDFYPIDFLTLHESIALVLVGTNGKTLEIWTTKELKQGRESWIKVFNIVNMSIVHRPFGFWKCQNSKDFLFMFNLCIQEKEVMKDTMKGIYINERGEIKYLNDQGEIKIMTIKVKNNIIELIQVLTYVETLVALNRL